MFLDSLDRIAAAGVHWTARTLAWTAAGLATRRPAGRASTSARDALELASPQGEPAESPAEAGPRQELDHLGEPDELDELDDDLLAIRAPDAELLAELEPAGAERDGS